MNIRQEKRMLFYNLSEGNIEVEYKNLSPDAVNVGLVRLEELENIYQSWGFSEATIHACHRESKTLQNTLSVYDDYSFGIIHVLDTKDVFKKPDRMAFYIKKNLFLAVDLFDEDKSTISALIASMEHLKAGKCTMERLISGFLSNLICEDNIMVENMETSISKLEKKVTLHYMEDFNSQFLPLRSALLRLRNYYEQIVVILEDLQENVNDIFEEESLRYFKVLTDRVTRLSNNIQMLRDYASQVREAHQEQMDYRLNNTMKLFTVVTTIFLPLTLIVGWYGMNFKYMPELTWKYGYYIVIIISILVILFCIWLFKKKKWF